MAALSYADVEAAAQAIAGVAHRTPVMSSRQVNDSLGAQVFFKCENFQRVGAFKFRGAYNALSRFGAAQRRRGVIAFSSGNHAQAVALAAQLLRMPAVIVMPQDAPADQAGCHPGLWRRGHSLRSRQRAIARRSPASLPPSAAAR